MVSDSYQMAHGLLAIIFIVILTAFLTYCFIKLRNDWHKQHFVKRRPVLALIMIICIWFYLFGVNLYGLDLLIIQIDSSIDKKMIDRLVMTGYLICIMFIAGFAATAYGARTWLLYYDLKLAQALKNKEWQMAINPDVVSSNWYLNPRNQRRFGGDGYNILRIGITIDIIFFVTFIASYSIITSRIEPIGLSIMWIYFAIKVT